MESSVLDGDLRIGEFVVRPLLKVIRPFSGGVTAEEQTLPDKAMAVLVYLAQHARQVCERDDILDAVWGPEREAYDRVLDNAIREIRRALNDDARSPTYVQTIPKKGYRLLVPVESRLLEKQRDSSGEFVPVVHDSAQVFQRVRRGESRPTAHLPNVRPVDAPPAPSRTRSPSGQKQPWLLLAAAVVLALVTLAAWRSDLFSSEKVTVAIDVDRLESGGAALASESGPTSAVLEEAIRKVLFQEHACSEKSVFAPDSLLRAADFRVRLRKGEADNASLLTAEIEPGNRRAVFHLDADRDGGSDALARQVAEQLDQAVCELDGIPDGSRACHCLEGSRRWTSLPDSQASVEPLELAITLDPDLIPAYAALAEAFRAGGNFDAGLSVLKTGLAKIEDPDSTEALRLRLQLARLLEDPSEEERLLDRLRGRDPDDMRLRLAQAGFLTRHRHRCEEALEILAPLMAEENRPVAVTVEASRAMWHCGQLEQTIEMVAEQVESLPRQGELRRWFAMMLSLVGRYEDAAHYATESMALEPERSEPYWVLGVVADRQGHYSAAEMWYEKAADLARWPKQTARAAVGLARVARMRGDVARCVELTTPNQVPIILPHEPPVLMRGLCLVESGQVEEARNALREFGTTLGGQSTLAHKSMALLLQAKIEMAEASTKGEKQQAASRFVEATQAYPVRLDMFYFEAGEAYRELGDSESAEEWFRKSLEVNPDHPWSLCRLGTILEGRGDHDQAAEEMRRGLRIFGPRLEDPLAQECDGALRRVDSDWSSAASTFAAR